MEKSLFCEDPITCPVPRSHIVAFLQDGNQVSGGVINLTLHFLYLFKVSLGCTPITLDVVHEAFIKDLVKFLKFEN